MADRFIIFSAPMVRALLDGRKTQTRRALKPQPSARANLLGAELGRAWFCDGEHPRHHGCDEYRYSVPIPYAPGDRLWVRETWVKAREWGGAPDEIWYRASDEHELAVFPRWRSPIHMPRWASRITLTVTDVRAQRVQEISEADAWAEGIDQRVGATCRDDFRELWITIHGPDAWDDDPWVAALTFAAEARNIDEGGVDG